MSTDFINIVSDKDRLQKELIFYSLFLMVFENFVSHWKETIRSFYSNGMAIDEQTGKYYDFVKVKWHDGQCFTIKDDCVAAAGRTAEKVLNFLSGDL